MVRGDFLARHHSRGTAAAIVSLERNNPRPSSHKPGADEDHGGDDRPVGPAEQGLQTVLPSESLPLRLAVGMLSRKARTRLPSRAVSFRH
jgi:hypothetical protein